MSRRAARKKWRADDVVRSLEERGITLRAASRRGVVEEAPGAYKDVDTVVDAAEAAGISAKVCR